MSPDNTITTIKTHDIRITNIESEVKDLKVDVKRINEQSLIGAKHQAELTATVKQSAIDLLELKQIVEKGHTEIGELKLIVNTEKAYKDGAKSVLQDATNRYWQKAGFIFGVLGTATAIIVAYITWHDWYDKQQNKHITNNVSTVVNKK